MKENEQCIVHKTPMYKLHRSTYEGSWGPKIRFQFW